MYVPRDDEFSEVKEQTFSAKVFYSVVHALLPSLETYFIDKDLPFPLFSEIDSLFNQGVNIPRLRVQGFWKNILSNIIKSVNSFGDKVFRFKTPQTMESKKTFNNN